MYNKIFRAQSNWWGVNFSMQSASKNSNCHQVYKLKKNKIK